ncbi:MAG TPA: hypothetical protein VFZ09_47380 [Archangium sp.]|uniref:hypothetical protein n=1 Tax=Archangium sp. TaxID=1872627 RepID=UPI002E329B75|nr:hypothetical protein [Archangium sp.]HEX5753898.1 hypothetical protein [Archangium sp.]
MLGPEGRFETLPARPSQMPRRFCLGVASCHQPFDDTGEMHEQGQRRGRYGTQPGRAAA